MLLAGFVEGRHKTQRFSITKRRITSTVVSREAGNDIEGVHYEQSEEEIYNCAFDKSKIERNSRGQLILL